MSNKKQTSVDWLFDRMVGLAEDYDDGKINYTTYINGINHFLDQAKEMHKEEIIETSKDSYIAGYLDNQCKVDDSMNFPEDYYNETFNTKEK